MKGRRVGRRQLLTAGEIVAHGTQGIFVYGFARRGNGLLGRPPWRRSGEKAIYRPANRGFDVRSYYSTTLAGDRLRRCYEIAPPRVRQYLREEIRFACQRVASSDVVLELGCGYGRVSWQLAPVARFVVGIDTSSETLRLARELSDPRLRCAFSRMDATRLAFRPHSFDVVICVQNGICAFHADPAVLLGEALRVVRSSGRLLFSSYAERFWDHRLDWFRRQAAAGLVGAVDEHATRPGTIVCRDGFTVDTMSRAAFEAVCASLGVTPRLMEVDDSSLFCEICVDSADGRT